MNELIQVALRQSGDNVSAAAAGALALLGALVWLAGWRRLR